MNCVAQFVLVCDYKIITEMGISVRRQFFDIKRNRLKTLTDETDNLVMRPEYIDKMIEIAQELFTYFKFVRVDLSEINGRL